MDAGKNIKVDYSVGSDKTEIIVTDEGDGFDPDNVPDPRLGENLYKTEGRGVLLMRSYMDEVKFEEHGNCVRMVRYKEKPG
jgi:serine/threonine-protein kinase RsbW